ncbi:glutathione S-transferase family protein [Shewanella sp. D64]|uniref:glutathione S-transferase family protein n=1 Tax=unclassified Shewanella TaxID=196818 RepID=UPI0022BA5A36|nr:MULTISPECIES: glutathione S-transferase family protein [unclassified Shewanella]MEC4723989.1 glutathione S-transferase family protein [Shewanella sp. D64]MEC4736009.1 glutathione S-transferase family protein [Shewanella sp. E94]WBJ98176.1 glutathione S-transferase family protein [Shewanella sp. MTB7]
MGLLVEGKWQNTWYDTTSTGGKFERKASSFRNWITKDGAAGPSGVGGFKAEADRYHLYVSLACPWAHRTIIYRKLKGLDKMITMSVVNAFMGDDGWTFEPGEGVIPDPIQHAQFAHQIYTKADANYTGRVTVPILWDKKTNTIVSNESAEIIRMFNSAFDDIGVTPVDYSPANLLKEIDQMNDYIYPTINNGVYRAGFATTQAAYDGAVDEVFTALDTLEALLANQRYLVGANITEADWRLFTTLVRFDPVYVGHFKCNKKRIVDYPNLWGYLRDMYQQPGVSETVDIAYIKAHYYGSHESINPTRIIPKGPLLDFTTPHLRG